MKIFVKIGGWGVSTSPTGKSFRSVSVLRLCMRTGWLPSGIRSQKLCLDFPVSCWNAEPCLFPLCVSRASLVPLLMWLNLLEIEVISKWRWSDTEAKPKLSRHELEFKWTWNLSKIGMRSKRKRSESDVHPKRTQSETMGKSMWGRSEIQVESKWNRSDLEVNSKFVRIDT